jgi:flagellar protein FliL
MAETAKPQDAAPKGSKLPLLAGLALAAALGRGRILRDLCRSSGFRAVNASDAQSARSASNAAAGHAYLPLDTLVISLSGRSEARHLRFTAQLEVPAEHLAEVTRMGPRILDVLNIYLRALAAHEIEEPAALLRLRAQMLRRVQIVTGPGMVNDLLVTEFVLN